MSAKIRMIDLFRRFDLALSTAPYVVLRVVLDVYASRQLLSRMKE